MGESVTFRYSDKVKIIKHENSAYVGKIGTIQISKTIHPAINGQVIKKKLIKVRLNDTGEIADCFLCQLSKIT